MSFNINNGGVTYNKRQRTENDEDFKVGHGANGVEELRRKRQSEPSPPNHVLLLTVFNPVYPITVDVLHTICTQHGKVLRIVIFKKNGVQAMVEFDSLESATRAKEALNSADIYSGCCTLKIDYAKPEKLNVHKNDSDSWDYTVTTDFGYERFEDGGFPPYPEGGFGDAGFNRGGGGGGGAHMVGGGNGGVPLMKDPPQNGGMGRPGVGGLVGMAPYQGGGGPNGSVMMVYGLDAKRHNTDSVFNIMCLYGNVMRVKFLKSKEGTAMVQMSDAVSVERCIMHLNNVQVGDNKLQVAFSKQAFLSEVTNPFPLFDKTPSFKDYSNNKNNRFLNVAQASKNRIQPPSKILHFFNTPPNVQDRTINDVFHTYDVAKPVSIKLFPSKSERSSSGLLEFATIAEAVQAIMACNHAAVDGEGTKFPFTMKLCFSSSRNISSGWLDEMQQKDSKMHESK
uniref:Putative polypyrimidine tract-binding protein n=1 Tax=Xenopsylla cheopis TaxID=163159 RepID=A0A6M2DU66_XENCH